jgi:LysM repeat protein
MKIRNFVVTALASAILVTMSGFSFAEGPGGPMQQNAPIHQGKMVDKHPGQYQQNNRYDRHDNRWGHRVRYIRVHWGDTLSKIAYRYHTSVWNLKRLNHLHGNTIYVGQRLRIS